MVELYVVYLFVFISPKYSVKNKVTLKTQATRVLEGHF